MIVSLQLENFRNFETLNLNFQTRSIVLCGSNGQGKTSILESLFLLATLRSFRTTRLSEMIRMDGNGKCRVCGGIHDRYDDRYEFEFTSGERHLRKNGQSVSRASEFTGAYKTIAFLPDDPFIITGPSLLRRRFFDMFISMMSKEYFTALQKYSNALKARNLLLKRTSLNTDVISAYDAVLAQYGSYIIENRFRYVRMIGDFMRNILKEVRPELSNFELNMRYTRGLENPDLFRKKLAASLPHDSMVKCTSCGPHLDDFEFIVEEKNLRNYGSRGQCRIVSLVLKLAELDIVNSGTKNVKDSVVLVDDATGDLDRRAKDAFYNKIKDAGQVFYAFTGFEEKQLSAESQTVLLSDGKVIQ